MAATSTRLVVCPGAIAGFSALALIANPAIGSATVTCSSTVTNSATTIRVALHDIAVTEALNHGEAQTFPFDAPVYDKTTSIDDTSTPISPYRGSEEPDILSATVCFSVSLTRWKISSAVSSILLLSVNQGS